MLLLISLWVYREDLAEWKEHLQLNSIPCHFIACSHAAAECYGQDDQPVKTHTQFIYFLVRPPDRLWVSLDPGQLFYWPTSEQMKGMGVWHCSLALDPPPVPPTPYPEPLTICHCHYLTCSVVAWVGHWCAQRATSCFHCSFIISCSVCDFCTLSSAVVNSR